jgi:acetolactate synthase-1/2/3 large subunit
VNGSTAIAHILAKENVEHLICFPHNPIIDAGAAIGIRPILTRTERVAVNIADGLSRVSNRARFGVVAVQDAAGIENAFAGVAQAFADRSPVLLLPGGYPRREQGVTPNFQAIHNYRSVTKWVEMVNYAERLPQMMRRAFTLLRSGGPGPVMLEVPTDVMDDELPSGLDYEPTTASRPAGDPQHVRETVEALLAARAPVIVAGPGIFYSDACEELKQFAELTQTPVMTTLAGKSAFPEDHPLALGAGSYARPKMVDHFLARADFVLGLGTSFTRSHYVTPIPPGKTMAQVTISEADLNKDYSITYGVIGDAQAVLGQMIEAVRRQAGPEGRRGGAVAREVQAVKEAWLAEWMPRLTSDETPISPYRVIWELMHAVDRRRTTVTHDSGNPRDQMVPFFETQTPHGYIGWGKSTQLGTGLGLTMGAKLAAPDRLCVNLMGDAAFGMVGMDFETAVRSRIPILTIVINNSLLGGYDKYLPVSTARYGTRFLSGNYSKVADGLGGYTERVEQPEDLAPALRRCVAEVQGGRPALLEVITREEPVFSAP